MRYLAILLIFVLILGFGVAYAEEIDGINEPDEPTIPADVLLMSNVDEDEEIVFPEITLSPTDSTNTMHNPYAWTVREGRSWYYCNSDPSLDFLVKASIAQWVYLELDANVITWKVLKPGYFEDTIFNARLKSNGNVTVYFTGLNNLYNSEYDQITAWYRLQGTRPGWKFDTGFIYAPMFNKFCGYGFQGQFIEEDQYHCDITFRLLGAIWVINCDSACEYEDPCGAKIHVVLEEQKVWVTG